MKRKKYNIHPDFDKWANFNPPLNVFALKIMQKLMSLTFLKEKSDDEVNVERLDIPYNVGKTMRALIYSPKNIEKNAPCLLYFHGGGFVIPAAPYHYNNCRKYALSCRCKVLFLDYPLAPQKKYPVPLEACFEGYLWLIQNAEKLSINKTKIVVGGDSAGGNLASVISMKAKDNGAILPLGQMLIYPAIGADKDSSSMEEFTDTPMCNSKDYKIYQKMYFKSKLDLADKYISPMKAKDFSIFPETYIETAEFDCLRDDAIFYANKLKKAKVKVTIHNTKQTIHGYDIVEDSKITLNSLEKRIKFLKGLFDRDL